MIVIKREDKLEKLSRWYNAEKRTYELLAYKVETLIRDILDSNGIKFHSINSRVKEVDSLLKKAKYKEYKDPINEIKDYAGIRIIAFVKSDVDKICDLIKPEFLIDELNSVNKSEELGDDKVGYRSVHYIAGINDKRLGLTEYASFKGMFFEIQIRTILEHSWADISHDRTYKFNKNLPEKNDIKRRFALAAATLELVDIEFDRLAREIEDYSLEVKSDTESGDLKHPIDSTSLESYISTKFNYPINDNDELLYNGLVDQVIKEYQAMNITTLKELDNLVNDISEQLLEHLIKNCKNAITLLRTILITSNSEKYFNVAWANSWTTVSRRVVNILEVAVPNILDYINEKDIEIIEQIKGKDIEEG